MEKLELACPHCQTRNRVPLERLNDAPQCGQCKQPLLFGAPLAADAATLLPLMQSGLTLVLDFWAPWCGPCRQFAPVFEQAAQRWGARAVFVKVNTEAEPMLAQQFQIRSIPTLMVWQGGSIRQQMAGALPAGQFDAWLQPVLGAR